MQERPLIQRTFDVTHRGRAGHINIQHYAQLIDDASRVLIQNLGFDNGQPVFTSDESVRFLAELHAGDEVAVYSRSYKLDQQTLQFSGELRRTRDAKTVCIFLRNIINLGTQADQAKGWGNVAEATNSSLESSITAIEADFPGEILNTFESQVDPQDTDEHGVLFPRALWHLITEALWATQSRLGADPATLKEKGITGGATVFQLKHRKPIRTGTRLTFTTSAVGLSHSSIRMRHEVRSTEPSAESLLNVLYVLTFFNREQGKRCPISEVFPGRTFEPE